MIFKSGNSSKPLQDLLKLPLRRTPYIYGLKARGQRPFPGDTFPWRGRPLWTCACSTLVTGLYGLRVSRFLGVGVCRLGTLGGGHLGFKVDNLWLMASRFRIFVVDACGVPVHTRVNPHGRGVLTRIPVYFSPAARKACLL